MSPEAQTMDSSDLSSEEAKPEVVIHKDRVGADPQEGWRRGTRGELRKSCDSCTASKTKCCGGIPCDRCKKRQLACKFSKRRRCGPKAKTVEEKEKRARTGPSDDSGGETSGSNTMTQVAGQGGFPSPGYTPLSAAGIALPGSQQGLPLVGPSLPLLSRPGGGFDAPMTADRLSEVVKLIGPSSDGGSSGSGGASDENSALYHPISPRHRPSSAPLQQQQQRPSAVSSLLPGNDSCHGSPILAASGTASPREQRTPVAGHTNAVGHGPASMSHRPRSSAQGTPNHWLLMESHETADLQSPAPTSTSASTSTSTVSTVPKPPSDLLRGLNGIPHDPVAASMSSFQNRSVSFKRRRAPQQRLSSSNPSARRPQTPTLRGPLAMDSPGAAARAHLSTFLKSVGSLLPLPGVESLREALVRWEAMAQDEAEMMDVAPAQAVARDYTASLAGTGGAQPVRAETFDAMDDDGGGDDSAQDEAEAMRDGNRSEQESSHDPSSHLSRPALVNRGNGPKRREAGDEGGPGDDTSKTRLDATSEFEEACRAEAWAAIAVGALFSGLRVDQASAYSHRSLEALPRCLDAPLPEVASALLLHTLFWLHCKDKRKMARYFGFAQQVGLELELSSLLPEGLRHCLAFMSVAVTMALGTDKMLSLGVHMRDPGWWGVTTRGRPCVGSRIGALGAIAAVCGRICEDSKGQKAFEAVERATVPAIPPPQALTDLLSAAVEAVSKSCSRDLEGDARVSSEDGPTEHLMALLNGLKAYTQARRGESTDAEASARVTLSAVDRDPTVLHMPLTFILADASKRILESAAGENASKVSGSLATSAADSARKMAAAATHQVAAREKTMEHSGPPAAFGRADAVVGVLDVTPRRPTQPVSNGVGRGDKTEPGKNKCNKISKADKGECSRESMSTSDSGNAKNSAKSLKSIKGINTNSCRGGATDIMGMRDFGLTCSARGTGVHSPRRAGSTSPDLERAKQKKLSRAEIASLKWRPSSAVPRDDSAALARSDGSTDPASILFSSEDGRVSKAHHNHHPSVVGRAVSWDTHISSSRWALGPVPTSPRIVTGPEPSKWMDRGQMMSRTPSPGMVGHGAVHHGAGGRPSSSCDLTEARASGRDADGADPSASETGGGRLTLGPMPGHNPLHPPKYPSEPPVLSPLSGLKDSSGSFNPSQPYTSHISGKGGHKESMRHGHGQGAHGSGAVGVGEMTGRRAVHAGGEVCDADGDAELDEPLPNPLAMASQVSFDPNREDSTLHEYIFTSVPRDLSQ